MTAPSEEADNVEGRAAGSSRAPLRGQRERFTLGERGPGHGCVLGGSGDNRLSVAAARGDVDSPATTGLAPARARHRTGALPTMATIAVAVVSPIPTICMSCYAGVLSLAIALTCTSHCSMRSSR